MITKTKEWLIVFGASLLLLALTKGLIGSVALAAPPGSGDPAALEADGSDLLWGDPNLVRILVEAGGVPGLLRKEARLILVSHKRHQMNFYRAGKLVSRFEVGFGQSGGRKRKRGDNRSPQGMYFVVFKRRGTFTGPSGDYYGGHWIKINYPSAADALWGREHSLLSPRREREIRRAWSARRLTAQNTKLGGGIGFHGWNGEWSGEGGAHLSWGCIVMHNQDIKMIYEELKEGTMVVIF